MSMELQGYKFVSVTPPGAIVDDAAFTTAAVDTAGATEVAFVATFGAMDIAATVLKVRESDSSDMSNATDVTGLVWGTSTNPDTGSTSSLPTSTSDNTIWAAFVKLTNGRKRYLDMELTGGNGSTGTYCSIVAILDPKIEPSSATTRGLSQNLIA